MLDSILSPVILGPAKLIRSSVALPWQSLLIEKYSCNPGERPEEKPLDRPVLVMLCSPTWRGEKKAADGTFVSTSKTAGALTVVPKGPRAGWAVVSEGRYSVLFSRIHVWQGM